MLAWWQFGQADQIFLAFLDTARNGQGMQLFTTKSSRICEPPTASSAKAQKFVALKIREARQRNDKFLGRGDHGLGPVLTSVVHP